MIHEKLQGTFLKTVVACHLIIVATVCVRSTVLGNYHVPTGSMKPGIIEGDRILANNLAYGIRVPYTKMYLVRWDTPRYGDIIAFYFPEDESRTYTKRVIGLPGDTVQLKNNRVYLNGKMIPRRFYRETTDCVVYKETLPGKTYSVRLSKDWSNRDTTEPFLVPEGCLFVLGDNRNNSSDSRAWGFVPVKNVTGKLWFRWFGIDPETGLPALIRVGEI